jgi:hypothetical protein
VNYFTKRKGNGDSAQVGLCNNASLEQGNNAASSNLRHSQWDAGGRLAAHPLGKSMKFIRDESEFALSDCYQAGQAASGSARGEGVPMKTRANPTHLVELMNSAPRCSATSKRSGCRCRAPAVRGRTVCRMHGAGAGDAVRILNNRVRRPASSQAPRSN